MKKRILVAMSGGVDSSVAAALLKEEGHDVAGATIRTWASNTCASRNTRACCGLTGVEDAREVSDSLGIPYWVFNFEEEFKKHVVDAFASEYQKGRTPNPCISCNEHIKFRLFWERARELGYDYIATGHYAQIDHDPFSGTYAISQGLDAGKDQSYVLFPLAQNLLAHLFLPVGQYTKAEIRQKAREHHLCVMNKPDSQEICFIPSNDYGTFLEKEYIEAPKKGVIRMKDGTVLGEHEGYYHFTKGQRRGLGVAFSEKLYVLETDPEKNEVIVGKKEDVLAVAFEVGRMHWFMDPFRYCEDGDSSPVIASPPKAGEAISGLGTGSAISEIASLPAVARNDVKKVTFRAQVKIRSQHSKAWASVTVLSGERVRIIFEDPQDAITPGQAAVIYDGPRVVGGGWIDRVEN